MKKLTLDHNEIDHLIANTRFSMGRDSLKLAQTSEEYQPSTYQAIKDRLRSNGDLLKKLFDLQKS